MKQPRAVVLVSGGLDSATTLAIARSEGFDSYALSVRYGQRHEVELRAAERVSRTLGASRHLVVAVDIRALAPSALTSEHIAVPKDRRRAEIGEGIPVTYVPARNSILLSLALGWAETLAAEDIFIGVNAVDYSGYPDCRPEFLAAFERMAALATKAAIESGRSVRIHAPLIHLSKSQIIARGLSLGVDYSETISCYDPVGAGILACGRCDACAIRRQGFRDHGIEDPARYVDDLASS
jgi:7-cyano-7-deazaguanine synthase